MEKNIKVNILEDVEMSQISFEKSGEYIFFEIYGDEGFYYNGKIESSSNSVKLVFDNPSDKLIFIKIVDRDQLNNDKTYTKFFNYTVRSIKKNISMKITRIEEEFNNNVDLESLLNNNYSNNASDNEDASDNENTSDNDNSDSEDDKSDTEDN